MDSENKKNLQDDRWRLEQLSKCLSNPKHPYHKFSTGNLETLRDEPKKRGVAIREEFMKFHATHYSANRTKLVVLGQEPLDELESWVADLFAGVTNKDLPAKRWDGEQPFTDKEILTQIFAKPVMDTRRLKITFPYRDEEDMYETHPSRYISHLIGHEGPGSILAYIKAKGWADELSAGADSVCPGSSFFKISIRLTEDGLKDYEEVVKVVFQYISLIKENPPQRWISDEIRGMAEVDFRFRQKYPASSFTSSMSSTMQRPYPREQLLSASTLIRRFDPEAITKGLTFLRPDNYRLTIISQDYPGDWDHKERWYGTEYKSGRIDVDFEAAVRKAAESTADNRIPELHLPHVNEFIPTRLSVEKKDVTEPSKIPKLIRNDDAVRLWWKKDDQFWVPKSNILVSLRNPLGNVTPGNTVRSKMYCELVKDALVEYSYDAEIAGLQYTLLNSASGLGFDLSGYNDKMPVLLEKVLVSMRDLEVKPDRFKIVKERLLRGYRNWDFQQPYKQIREFSRWLGSDKAFINDQLLAELPHLTPDDISSFYPQLLRQVHIEILAHGNVYKEDALRMTNLIETTLKPRALPQSQWQIRRNLILPEDSDFSYQKKQGDPANVNHCVEYYLQIGDTSNRVLTSKLMLLAQLTQEAAFDQLRSKEQLGYIVFTGEKHTATSMGYQVLVQSERTPEYLEERINAFLSSFGISLVEMPEAEFERHKTSKINEIMEKDKNLDQETWRFWGAISSEYYDFLDVDEDVKHLKPITKNEMIDFYNHYINPTSPTRSKLSIHLIAQASAKAIAEIIPPEEQKDKLVSLLGKYMITMGVPVDQEQLITRFSNLDITTTDQTAILSTTSDYLTTDAHLPSSQAEQILSQGQKLLATVLPSLGIELRPTTDGAGADEFPKAPETKKTTWIENVYYHKAGLAVSRGPEPVMALEALEELEPKL